MTIIVPYRNRESQLTAFIKHMAAYLPGAAILIVEQADNKPFNRGKLINCAVIESQPDYFAAHDVDMLDLSVDYSERIGVTQLASSEIQTHGYLGGVTMFDIDTFKRLGGYHNDYFSRSEDCELYFNCLRLRIPVINRFGVYDMLPHERSGPEFIPWLWAKSKQQRAIQNQLSVCKYEVVSSEQFDTHKIIRVFL